MTEFRKPERITLDDPRDYLDWREGSGWTVEIVDIHVGSERRRQGLGRKLVEALFAKLEPDRHVFAITRADNEIAIQWYEALQFRVIGVLRRFYAERGVDAIMFGRKASGPV